MASDIAIASWGWGETTTHKGIIVPGKVDLGGSAIGIIKNEKRLILDKNLQAGDRILLLKSNGINANGLSLSRAIARELPKGYQTKFSDGVSYGETILTKTNIYAKGIKELLDNHIQIHYISNITGHGLRKLMRSRQKFSYIIENIFETQALFLFIQKHSNLPNFEIYQTLNMGMDYAIFLSEKDVKKAQNIIKKNKFESIDAGYVIKGERRVGIEPKDIEFEGESLQLR